MVKGASRCGLFGGWFDGGWFETFVVKELGLEIQAWRLLHDTSW